MTGQQPLETFARHTGDTTDMSRTRASGDNLPGELPETTKSIGNLRAPSGGRRPVGEPVTAT